MDNQVAVFWPTTVALDNIDEDSAELPELLYNSIKNQANNLAKCQLLPGQCSVKLPLLALCSWNLSMVHPDVASLRCHQIEGHDGQHAHNTKTGAKIRWRGNLTFDQVDWKAIREEQLNR